MPAQPQPLPPPAALPDLARRLAPTFIALIKLIAACFCRHPRFALIVVPLCRRLAHIRLRIERMLARLAAGKPAQRRSPPPRAPQPAPQLPTEAAPPAVARPRIPSSPAWLLKATGCEAAIIGTQLETLLAEPAVADLLARTPALAHLLQPVRRMLGIAVLPPKQRKPRQPRLRRTRPRLPTPKREKLPAWLQGRPPTASLQPLPWMVEKTRRS